MGRERDMKEYRKLERKTEKAEESTGGNVDPGGEANQWTQCLQVIWISLEMRRNWGLEDCRNVERKAWEDYERREGNRTGRDRRETGAYKRGAEMRKW